MKTKTERVDDIPLLIAEFKKSELSDYLNTYFPDHGNWKGTNGGKVTVGFLTYVLSCGDHRLSHVETWAAQRIHTLGHCLETPELTAKDFTDDKLGALLDKYSDMNQWTLFEQAHNQQLINVYNLNTSTEAIRLDAMITQSFRKAEGDFQFGHSKQHRSDLPQLKTMIATLDPIAMPLYSLTVAGNSADDPLYMPVIEILIEHLSLREQLFVGDSKMGSIETRARIHSKGHYYLVPLSKKQCSEQELAKYLERKPKKAKDLITITTLQKDGSSKVKAKAYEMTEVINCEDYGTPLVERRIMVFSPAYARTQQEALENRLLKAQDQLALLLEAKQGRRKLTTKVEVQKAVQQILSTHKVKQLLEVEIEEHIQQKVIRAYKDRPTRTEDFTTYSLQVKVNESAKAAKLKSLGWRAYATNAPVEKLSTQQAVQTYRNEYKIEHKFDQLINKVTALMPVLLQKTNRVKALICLLLLALKFVSLIEYQVRQELKTTKQKLKELYPGNPGRATDQPTTNLILKAFQNIHLVILAVDHKTYINLEGLKPIQLKILEFLKIPPESYLGLNKLVFSHSDFSET